MECCEQCARKPQVLYCLTCVKRLCLDCEDFHAHHSVVTVASGLQCQDHRLPFDLYCETCERLLCATCYSLHANQQHVLAAIQQVFRRKQSMLVSLMTQTAFEKKAAIQAQAGRLDKRIRDLRGYKTAIESDINQSQTMILERLHTWTSPFTQRLEKEKGDLARDLEALEGAERVINSPDKLLFLAKYRGITATLESLASKPITPEPEVPFDDLPREINHLRTNIQSTMLQQALNQARNDTIWDMLRSAPTDMQTSDAAVQREVLQWSRLTDKLMQQVADLQFVCYICKQKVTGVTVNESCAMNPVGKVTAGVSRDPVIPPALLGNGYHFVVNQHGDVKKQAERLKVAEQPKTLAQMQQTSLVSSLRSSDGHPQGTRKEDFAEELGTKWGYGSQARQETAAYTGYRQEPTSTQGYSGYGRKPEEPTTAYQFSSYSRQPEATVGSYRPEPSSYAPKAEISRPTYKPEQPTSQPAYSSFSRPEPSFLARTDLTPRPQAALSAQPLTDSFAPRSYQLSSQEPPPSRAADSKPSTQSDFMKTLKTGFSMLETTTNSLMRSQAEELPTRDQTRTNPLEKFTFGGPAARVSESIRSSFNPMDSFGAPHQPSEDAKKKPEPSKEVRFSYSDSFKSAAEPPQPSARPSSKSQPHQDPKTAQTPAKSLLSGSSWRDHIRSALSTASASFLSACKAFDNGAGEVPLDGLRVALHKSSTLLSLEDIDQAAKYIGTERVNYRSFLSAMTSS